MRCIYPLPFILRVISAESCPLAIKVTLKVIRLFFWQKISVESYALPKKAVEIVEKFPHKHGTRDREHGDKEQGTRVMGHGTRDMGHGGTWDHGTWDKGQGTVDKGQGTMGNSQ